MTTGSNGARSRRSLISKGIVPRDLPQKGSFPTHCRPSLTSAPRSALAEQLKSTQGPVTDCRGR